MNHKGSLAAWVVPAVITAAIVLSAWTYVAYKEIRATVMANRVEVGDRFEMRLKSRNPYEDDVLLGGTVIAKSGAYIQYVDSDGDTLSTNIRDVYLFPKTIEIKLIKKQ